MPQQYQEGQKLRGSDGKVYVVQGGVPREAMQPAQQPPAFIPGQVSPAKQAAEIRANEDQSIQREQLKLAQSREAREAAKDAGPVLGEEERLAIQQEAKQKIALIDRLDSRSKNGWLATGFGASTMSMVPGTGARDVAKDVETLSASGALQRIMEMAKNNGGKNPLTPLSNADFIALGQSISNLDPTQSDEQFQRNLKVYRDIYLRAFKAAGGGQSGQGGKAAPKRLKFNPATGRIE